MKTKFASLFLTGMLGACAVGAAEEPQELAVDRADERPVEDAGSIALSLVEYLDDHGTPFARAGRALSPVAVVYTDTVLDQFDAMTPDVADYERLQGFRQDLRHAAARFNDYERGTCLRGVVEGSGCSKAELDTLYTEAFEIQSILGDVHPALREWTAFDNILRPDELGDRDWMVALSPEIRLSMAMDLVMMIELYDLKTMPGLEELPAGPSTQDIRNTAREYFAALNLIEDRYPELEPKHDTLQDLAVGDLDEFSALQLIVSQLIEWNPDQGGPTTPAP